jgi:cytochrome b561
MKYSRAQIINHWLTVAVLIVMVSSGLAYTYDWVDTGSMGLHQIAGQAFIAILLVRMTFRFMHPVQSASTHSPLEDVLAWTVHLGLYLCLIAYVVTGYIAASGLRDPMLLAPVGQAFARSDTGELFLETHFALKWILLALFAIHIAAVLKHRYWDKDTTSSHMPLTFRKE